MTAASSNSWFQCKFTLDDVITVADARPLDDVAWASEGHVLPQSFAGAIRTWFLRQDFGNTTLRSRLGVPKQRKVALDKMTFRFAGPFIYDEHGHAMLPVPRIFMTDPGKIGKHVPRAQVSHKQELRADSKLDAPALLVPRGVDWEPIEKFTSLQDICKLLSWDWGGDVKTDPSTVMSGPEAFFNIERRAGHARSSAGIAEESMLYSRPFIRFKHTGSSFLGWIRFDDNLEWPTAPPIDCSLRLGGDGHLARVQISGEIQNSHRQEVQRLRDHVLERIKSDASESLLVVYLATPGIFKNGWRPEFPQGLSLVAAAIGRPITIGGWDLAHQRPKPVKRAVPSGSTYLLEIENEETAATFVNTYMFNDSLCDEPFGLEGRLGFGVALVGLWPREVVDY